MSNEFDYLYVVVLHHTDGTTTYSGKESWNHTPTPKEVFSFKSAQGKARHWRKISQSTGHGVNLISIDIQRAQINLLDEVGQTLTL